MKLKMGYKHLCVGTCWIKRDNVVICRQDKDDIRQGTYEGNLFKVTRFIQKILPSCSEESVSTEYSSLMKTLRKTSLLREKIGAIANKLF